jgi:hypothetical protein
VAHAHLLSLVGFAPSDVSTLCRLVATRSCRIPPPPPHIHTQVRSPALALSNVRPLFVQRAPNGLCSNYGDAGDWVTLINNIAARESPPPLNIDLPLEPPSGKQRRSSWRDRRGSNWKPVHSNTTSVRGRRSLTYQHPLYSICAAREGETVEDKIGWQLNLLHRYIGKLKVWRAHLWLLLISLVRGGTKKIIGKCCFSNYNIWPTDRFNTFTQQTGPLALFRE